METILNKEIEQKFITLDSVKITESEFVINPNQLLKPEISDFQKLYNTCAIDLIPISRLKANYRVGLRQSIYFHLDEKETYTTEGHVAYIIASVFAQFHYEGGIEEKVLRHVLSESTIGIIYPYLRAHINGLIASAGWGGFNLPLINVHKLFEKDKEEIDKIINIALQKEEQVN